MTSAAWWAFGSTLKIGDDGSTETFTAIAEITDLDGPGMSKATIEVTSHDSPNGWRERIPGLRDGGEVRITANWLPQDATQDETDGILSKFEDDDVHNWEIITAADGDGSAGTITVSFPGIVTSFNPRLPMEEQGQLDFSLTVAGKVTIGATT